MKLKKITNLSFDKTREYSLIYSDEKDLSKGIINVCNILNNATFVIKTFTRDKTINNLLQKNCHGVIINKNWLYYNVDDISFLADVNLENQRFLVIYSIGKFYENFCELEKQIEKFYFKFVLENYLELTTLSINLNHYSKVTIDNLLLKQSL